MKKIYLLFFSLAVYWQAFSQNYTILGNATSYAGCNCYQLTPDAGNQGGAVFQNHTIDLNNSFDYKFNVFLGCHNGDGNHGADGETFALTTNPNGLGLTGEYLGYGNGSNQPCSFAVEFDTWSNSSHNDPSYDHIAFESGGSVNHNVAGPVPALPNSGNIDNCVWHSVELVWNVNTGTFTVYFDGNNRLSYTDMNFVNDYFCGNPIVNWGWTAATGGGSNQQIVCTRSISGWVAGNNFQSCTPTIQFTDVSTSNVGNVQSWNWSFGDGGTSNQQNPSHTYAGNGTYTATLIITDVNGCADTSSHTVTIANPISITPSLSPPPCNGGQDGSITLSAAGGFGVSGGHGGYSYSWNDGSQGATHIGLGAGTYTVTATDGVCSATGQYTLNQPTALTATTSSVDASCGANNGQVSISISGGTTPYTSVTWVPGPYTGTTVTGLGANTYIADFHDANGCSALLQYTAVVGSTPCGYNLSTSHTNATCYGVNNGTATLTVTGGVAPITITWAGPNSYSGSGATITGLAGGSYTYTYHDGNNQTFVGTIVVTQPLYPMHLTMDGTNPSCTTNDGQAIVSVDSGGVTPYGYAWSNGNGNNPVASNLGAGTYTVTVTDANTCSATASTTLTAPPSLTVNVTVSNNACYQANGSATANPVGGTAPFTYFWSNISSAQTDLSLPPGNYTVTVTDANACTATGTAVITQATPLAVSIASTNITCYGQSDGSIDVTTTG
ncbi:MAG TPA: PKD domain-containing protein, partial [Chitinophagales bacterium]|nr:PKD domain-containing protein [Chitinophagales bacterium]